MLGCVHAYVHVRKAHGGAVDRRGQENTVFGTLLGLTKRFEASNFLTILTDSLFLRVAQMPRSRNLTIFMWTTDAGQTIDDRQTDCFTPAVHACTRDNE